MRNAMRNSCPYVALACALALGQPAFATRPSDVPAFGDAPQGETVPSSRSDALPVPSRWDCDLIRPEWEQWLRDGKPREDWRYAGPTYRDVDTGELYTWRDWLRWADEEGCATLGYPADAGGISSRLALTGLYFVTGVALLVAALGSGPDSPG